MIHGLELTLEELLHRFTIETVRILKLKFLLIILISLSINSYAQVNIDSLFAVWSDESIADTSRLNALDNFINNAQLKMRNDSALYYAQIQFEFSGERGLKEYSGDALVNMGKAKRNKGEYSEAIEYFQRSFEIFKEVDNKWKSGDAMFEIANMHWYAGEYEAAKEYYHSSLVIAKELGDKSGNMNV